MLKKFIGLYFLLLGIGWLMMACNLTWTTGSAIEDGIDRGFQFLPGILFLGIGILYPRSNDHQAIVN